MGSLLIAIDEQNSFMDGGELGVPGSLADVGRLCRFIRDNEGEISKIIASLDTHEERQIFHPVWWKDNAGNPPPPFTKIDYSDVELGVWMPAFFPTESVDYVKNLERLGKKELTIWTPHCIKGTKGHELEPRFAEAIRPFSVEFIEKGQDPLSEMYGIIKPEFSRKNIVNLALLNSLREYEKIYIAGEAASHCVLESVKQIVEHFADDAELKSKIHVLTDCMSPIPGFEEETEREFASLARVHGIKLKKIAG